MSYPEVPSSGRLGSKMPKSEARGPTCTFDPQEAAHVARRNLAAVAEGRPRDSALGHGQVELYGQLQWPVTVLPQVKILLPKTLVSAAWS